LPWRFDWKPVEAQFQSGGVEYRVPAVTTALPIMFALQLAAVGIIGVFAFLSPDPRDRNPAAFLAFSSTFTVYGLACCVWTFLMNLRHRLVIAPEVVRSIGVFGSREVRLERVDRMVWGGRNNFGYAVALQGDGVPLRLTFLNYDERDRLEMIHLLHLIAAGRTEVGWDQFEPRKWLQPVTCRSRGGSSGSEGDSAICPDRLGNCAAAHVRRDSTDGALRRSAETAMGMDGHCGRSARARWDVRWTDLDSESLRICGNGEPEERLIPLAITAVSAALDLPVSCRIRWLRRRRVPPRT
jgi:hypothetical protein